MIVFIIFYKVIFWKKTANIKLDKTSYKKGESVKVSVDLQNTGKLDGKEVAQVYIQDEFAAVVRPIKELKGFELVELKAGEKKTLTFILTNDELGFFNNQGEFMVEEGTFKVMVGGSSQTSLQTQFELL